jgi:hypothetical protein
LRHTQKIRALVVRLGHFRRYETIVGVLAAKVGF